MNLEILEAVPNQRTTRRTVLSLTEQKLFPPMIEQSDDDAATTLWGDVGGAQRDAGVRSQGRPGAHQPVRLYTVPRVLRAWLGTGSPSQEYGIDTLNHLGAMVWSTLAPHR